MKIGKNELKALIKECLVELLAEGLGSNLNEAVAASPRASGGPRNRDVEPLPGQRPAPRGHVDSLAARRRALDEIRVAPQQTPPPPVQQAVSALTRDPIMAAIFADTAQTTLVEQNSGARPGGDRAAQAIANVDPTSMFDEAQIDKWNEAAFKPTRPTGLMGGALPPDFLQDLLKGG